MNSIKKLLGVDIDCTDFDVDIITHINTVLSILTQIGIGPRTGFYITGTTEKWSDFVTGPMTQLVQSYVYLKVRKMFDPAIQSTVATAIDQQISELEWRLSVLPDMDVI